MKRYKEISDFGQHIELDDGKEDWYFVLGRNRDSDLLEQSNFECALRELGGESETVAVVRFGHWAVGWVDYLLADERHKDKVKDIQDLLKSYPCLDDEDYYKRISQKQFDITLEAVQEHMDRIAYTWQDKKDTRDKFKIEDERTARALLRYWDDNDCDKMHNGEEFWIDDDMLQEGLDGLERDRKDARDVQNPYPVLKEFEFKRLMPKWEFERLMAVEV